MIIMRLHTAIVYKTKPILSKSTYIEHKLDKIMCGFGNKYKQDISGNSSYLFLPISTLQKMSKYTSSHIYQQFGPIMLVV